MHKTRLTQNNKQNTPVIQNKNMRKEGGGGERENKWQNHLEPFSFHTLEEPFRFENYWSGGEGEELKPFKFESDRPKTNWPLVIN